MKLQGFIGPAYTLDSVNVDAQRCVNLYPEIIESGSGKEGNVVYLKATPGLDQIDDDAYEVGDGPIRCIHTDAIGRTFVVSGNKLYRVAKREHWSFNFVTASHPEWDDIDQSTDINTSTEEITKSSHLYTTGVKVQVSSSDTLPTGLSGSTDYWIIRVDDNKFKLASSLANSLAGTAIDITGAGTGTMTVTAVTNNNAGFEDEVPATVREINNQDDVDYDNDLITVPDYIDSGASGLYTGLKVKVYALGTPLPTGLTQAEDYYIISISDNTVKLATSVANASAGTAIDLSAVSGSWSTEVIKSTYNSTGASDAQFDTSSGLVRAASSGSFSTNRHSITLFVDGESIYLLSDPAAVIAPTFTEKSSSNEEYPALPRASHIVWIDGYFIINEIDTNRFFTTNIGGTDIDALAFASSEGNPDVVLAIIDNHRDLWVFNEKTTEVYVNTGNADFPFERVQGGFLEVGCLAKYSVAKIDGAIFWLGRSEHGHGAIYSAQGLRPQRISTHAIEQAISGYADASSASAYAYSSNGHSFYVLNFDEATWVYDLSTQLWHERAYTNNGDLERHRAETHVYDTITGLHIVGDYENNKIFKLSDSKYSDDGDELTRLRSSPHISADTKRLFCSKFQLDMETGIGLESGQGSDPQVMLDWSDDGGHTWSDESWTSAGGQAGGIGEYSTRVIWRRLGKFRDRIFRVTITDPVPITLLGAHLEVASGGH